MTMVNDVPASSWRAEQQLGVFSRAAALLASSLEFDDTLAHTISAYLPALGDFGFFDVVMQDGVRRTARAHEDPRIEAILLPTQWVRQDHNDMNLCALSTGQPGLHEEIDDDWYCRAAASDDNLALLRQLAFRSMITVPMHYRDELIGALTLFMGHSGRRHTEADLAFAQELALLATPVVVNARLIETQRRVEAALRLSEERLRLATDAGGIGLWDWDIKLNKVTWSESGYALYGLKPGDFGGQAEDFIPHVHPDDWPIVRQKVMEALQGTNSYIAEYRTIYPDGSIRWLATRAIVSRNPEGQPVRLCGAVFDITQRVELLAAERAARAEAEHARREAELASRAKDDFLAMLGHELRNPLAPIVTALELIELRGDHSMQYERDVIARQVAHLSRLVDDLLDISRITQGKVELKLERLDIAMVIAKATELMAPVMEKSGLKFDFILPSRPIHLVGDAVRLTQIFSNLLSNATKFTPAGGRVTLEATVEGTQLKVAIRDSGIGIAPELLPHVFDMFVQGPQHIDRQAGGLGLGLTIAKTLVSLHGGSITAESLGPGQGSTFCVRLPSASDTAPDSYEPPCSTEFAATGRILIVDDNADAGETLAQLLRTRGHDVRHAMDGAQALHMLASFTPDLAVLDIGLPAMDGYELARRLRDRQETGQLRLIALTGYGREHDERRAHAAGFDQHVVKPVDPRRFLDIVAQLLENEAA